jgi:predicted nucleic acid-binding protein
MYLLDTDWVIQTLADRQPARGTLERLAGSRVYISYITVGEI